MRFSLLPSLDEKKAQVAKLDSRAITMAREPPRRRTDLRLPRQGALAFCRADGYARERRDVKSRHLGEGIKPTKREFLRRFSSDPRHRLSCPVVVVGRYVWRREDGDRGVFRIFGICDNVGIYVGYGIL